MSAARGEERTLTDQVSDTQPQDGGAETGYAPVNALRMYYEIHGSGGVPLLLLHGGLFNIDLQFGEVLPGDSGPMGLVQLRAALARAALRRSSRPPGSACR